MAEIPKRWISCARISKPIKTPVYPNLTLYSMKAPLPSQMSEALGEKESWSVLDVKGIIKASPNAVIRAVNVSSKHEYSDDEWIKIDVNLTRIPIEKEYGETSAKQFCDCIEEVLKSNENNEIIILVYCGCGVNRSGFCIVNFLAMLGQMSINDAYRQYIDSHCSFGGQKAIKMLEKQFSTELEKVSQPEFYAEDFKPIPIGEIPLKLDNYITWKKFIKSDAETSDKDEVLKILFDSLPDSWPVDSESKSVQVPTTIWNHDSIGGIATGEYMCTFSTRNNLGFLVILDKNRVFTVTSTMDIHLLPVTCTCKFPTVAVCMWYAEKKRETCLLQDILLYDGSIISEQKLHQRQLCLYNDVVKSIKSDPSLQIVYRPLTELSNIKRLRNDLPNLFCRPDGISLVPCNAPAGSEIILPIDPTVLLKFDYNGNNTAVLISRGADGIHDQPVGLCRFTESKMKGLDGRISRFKFDDSIKSWVPFLIGDSDPATSAEEVKALLQFIDMKINIEDTLSSIEELGNLNKD